ncbi:MAG: prepilin peptidase [Pseudomonadota bacterium]
MFLNILTNVVVFLIGAAVGSFANVCIYRLPRYASVVHPGSMCPHCGTPIPFYDNIPVLSYILLGARCRFCDGRINLRYPLIEVLVGVAALWLFRSRGVSATALYAFVLTVALLIGSMIDLEHRIIPDVISVSGIWIGLTIAAFAGGLNLTWWVSFKQAVVGAALGWGLLWSVGKAYEWISGREGIGFGDVKLLALFGAHGGISGVLVALFYGSLVGSVVGVGLMAFYRKGRRYPIPFGPFLCLGFAIWALFGQRAIDVPLSRFLGTP